MRPRATAIGAALLVLAAAPAPVAAADAYSEAFVAAFAEACVPARLSYRGTIDHALSVGWGAAEATDHPELAAMMAASAAGMEQARLEDPEMQFEFEGVHLSKTVAGSPHFLYVGRTSAIIGDPEDPLNPWVYIGCYLYNFEATGMIDPAPVSALLDKPISHSIDHDGVVGHVWGPGCAMPRTGDTYLTLITEAGSQAAVTGFSGLVIKFETSEPDPDQVVPETYCTGN